MDEKNKKLILSEEEEKVIQLMREISFGELRIIVNNSKPERVEEIQKSIQL